MTMRGLALLIVAVTLVIGCSAQCPYASLTGWVASGFATSGDVLVPAGQSVKFDLTGTVNMNSLIIQGTVAFDNVDVNLNIGFIKVQERCFMIEATFELGSLVWYG